MKRRTQDEWRELIEQQKESGLSATQFCNERDINDKYFSTIKYKLSEKSNVSAKRQSNPTLLVIRFTH